MYKKIMFRVEDKAHSRMIQQVLFNLGRSWRPFGQEFIGGCQPLLFIDLTNKNITHAGRSDYRPDHPYREETLESFVQKVFPIGSSVRVLSTETSEFANSTQFRQDQIVLVHSYLKSDGGLIDAIDFSGKPQVLKYTQVAPVENIDLNSIFQEEEEKPDELSVLIAKVDEGGRAIEEIKEKYPGQVEFRKKIGGRFQEVRSETLLPTRAFRKKSKKRFSSFVAEGNEGHDIYFDDNQLKVGCKVLTRLVTLKYSDVFKRLRDGKTDGTDWWGIAAARHGIVEIDSSEYITWESVDKLIERLEEVGE